MRSLVLLLLFCLGVSTAHSKTILVTDIDDTLKLANVLDRDHAFFYSFDEKSRFFGMSELFHLLKKDNPDLVFYYLSRAPSWWMKSTHLKFLKNGNFPEGTYIPRTKYSLDEHKLLSLREIINRDAPDKVIFFGDNGEKDSDVYEQVKNEYSGKGIQFYQFIRLAYSSQDDEDAGVIPFADQVGFVTPVEVSLELKKEHLLVETSVSWVMENIASVFLKQPEGGYHGVVTFPTFMRCNDFVWKWNNDSEYVNLSAFKQKVLQRCQEQ